MSKYAFAAFAAILVVSCAEPATSQVDGPVALSFADVQARAKALKAPLSGLYALSVNTQDVHVSDVPEAVRPTIEAALNIASEDTICLDAQKAAEWVGPKIGPMMERSCTFSQFDVAGYSMRSEMRCEFEGRDPTITSLNHSGAQTWTEQRVTIDGPLPKGGAVKMTTVTRLDRIGDC